MQNNKKFLYCCILNFMCVFPAISMNSTSINSTVTPTNTTVAYAQKFNTTHSHNHTNSTQNKNINKKKSHRLQDMVKKEKQEKNNILLNEIRDKIDKNHLGIDEGIWFRGLRGTLNSYCKSTILTDQDVMNEIHTIKSYLPAGNKTHQEHLLKKLEEKHWYVNYLLQRSLDIKNNASNVQSMKRVTPPSNDDGYQIVYKDLSELPKPTPISKKFNALSERLYAKNITDARIRDLVKKGAEVNYQKVGDNGPLVFRLAYECTPQDVKNMQTLIDLGAAIHNIEGESHIPLTIALEQAGSFRKDCTDMIRLLIPHENPTVTIYQHEYYDKNSKWERTETDSREQSIREFLISQSFRYPNIATIKLLLALKLMTANRGLKTFAYYMQPNQAVLNLLLQYGATNKDDVLPQVMNKAFPSSDQYIDFLKQICASGAFNKEVLKRVRTLKEAITTIQKYLEKHSQGAL
jgi:hypothetical protein